MTGSTLQAALYTEAVLPAYGLVAPHDPELPALLAGDPFGVSLLSPGLTPVHLGLDPRGLGVAHDPVPGDLRFWFPHPALLARTFQKKPTLALPVGGWKHLRAASARLRPLGARLETVLDDRAAARRDPSLAALHVFANLLVGVAGASCWLRRHPDGPARHLRLGRGLVSFACEHIPGSPWLDLATLRWGPDSPPRAADARVEFSALDVALDEFDHRLDTLAALGSGAMRIAGHLPLAESLGLIMLEVERLLHPPSAR